jgi:hypothetical protein
MVLPRNRNNRFFSASGFVKQRDNQSRGSGTIPLQRRLEIQAWQDAAADDARYLRSAAYPLCLPHVPALRAVAAARRKDAGHDVRRRSQDARQGLEACRQIHDNRRSLPQRLSRALQCGARGSLQDAVALALLYYETADGEIPVDRLSAGLRGKLAASIPPLDQFARPLRRGDRDARE